MESFLKGKKNQHLQTQFTIHTIFSTQLLKTMEKCRNDMECSALEKW